MLAPTILQPFLASLSRTLARGTDDPEAAVTLLGSFHPQDPLQAMLAAQAIALHHAAMDCFGRAMETGPEDHATAARLQRNAASLTRAFTATLRTLQRCQAEAARENSMQREDDAGGAALPAAFAQARAEGATTRSAAEPEALDSRFREDDGGRPSRSATDLAENLRQRPAPRWEDLTEAEQFAILYPERVAAGATSHEDAHLWLFNPAVKQPHATWETASASSGRRGAAAQDAGQPHVS